MNFDTTCVFLSDMTAANAGMSAADNEKTSELLMQWSTPPITANDNSDLDYTSDGPADHVIFVIHGIGQQTEKYGMFKQHMQSLRNTMHQVLQARMPHQEEVHIEMIPIEWHRHIHKETDPAVHRILPKSIPTLRLIESDYLADVLYYFSKDRGQSIINHVTREFNATYNRFIKTRPNFTGKIAILGYSLGGLITWDILAHQRQDLTAEELLQFGKFDIDVPKLDFKPDYLFGMGCPVAGLLVSRNQDPRLYHPDPDVIFENIYHPFDPLAFRMEPLLNQEYTDIPAVSVDRAIPSTSFLSSLPSLFSFFSSQEKNSNNRGGFLSSSINAVWQFFSRQDEQQDDQVPDMQHRRASEGDISNIKRQLEEQENDYDNVSLPCKKTRPSMRPRANTMPYSGSSSSSVVVAAAPPPAAQKHINAPPHLSSSPDSSCCSTIPATPTTEDNVHHPCLPLPATNIYKESLPGGRRCDYELVPDSIMGMISNEYILGLRAHFSYWTNKDMLWHIYCRMENI